MRGDDAATRWDEPEDAAPPPGSPTHWTRPAAPAGPAPGATRWSEPGGGAEPTPGEVVDGRYQVEQLLGRGGMGAVWAAREVSSGQRVALKTMPAASPEAVTRFQREAELLARVDRAGGVVRIHAAGVHRGLMWVATELVDGPDLGRVIGAEGPLEPRRLAGIVAAVARTLQACHAAGVLHRDLKPGNVLLAAGDAPRLCDFGLARDPRAERLTRTGELLGTPAYMAPEQASDAARALDARVDVWGLGGLLYCGLTGQPPFGGGSALETLRRVMLADPVLPRRLRPGLPRELEAICLQALEKEPARRYPDAQALAEDLERWLRGEPVEARASGRGARLLARWRRGEPRAVLLGRAGAGGLVVAAAGLVLAVAWAAPRALSEELRWQEEVLRGSSFGLLPDDPPLPPDELERRAARLRRAAWLLPGESRARARAAADRLGIPSALARGPRAAPGGEDGPGLLLEGLLLLAQPGRAGAAQERLGQALARGEDGLALRAGLLRAGEALAASDPAAAAELLVATRARARELLPQAAPPAWTARERPLVLAAAGRALLLLRQDALQRGAGLAPEELAGRLAGLEAEARALALDEPARAALASQALAGAAGAWAGQLAAASSPEAAATRLAALEVARGPGQLPPALVAAVARRVEAALRDEAPREALRLAGEARLRLGVVPPPALLLEVAQRELLEARGQALSAWVLLAMVHAGHDPHLEVSAEGLVRHLAPGDPELRALRQRHPGSQALALLELEDRLRAREELSALLPLIELCASSPARSDLGARFQGEAGWRLARSLRKLAWHEAEGSPERALMRERAVELARRARPLLGGSALLDLVDVEAETLLELGRGDEELAAREWAVGALRAEVRAREEGRRDSSLFAAGVPSHRGHLARALDRLAGSLVRLERLSAAEAALREAVALWEGGALPASTSHPGDSRGDLAQLLVRLGRRAEAEAVVRRAAPGDWADEELAGVAIALALEAGQSALARQVLEAVRRAVEAPPPGWVKRLEKKVAEAAPR